MLGMIYPLVMTNMTNCKDPPCYHGGKTNYFYGYFHHNENGNDNDNGNYNDNVKW